MTKHPRRAFVLLAVLVIVGSALLVATALLFVTQTEAATATRCAEVAQSRALAWSGLQAMLSRLADQRDDMLAGTSPRLDRESTIYESGSRRGVVRLLEIGPDGERLVAEAGRLDLNAVDAETLTATGFVDEATAAQIVAARAALPNARFTSVAALLDVSGVTPELLYGPLDDIAPRETADLDRASRPGVGRTRGLADLVTVWSVEPALQRDGRLRIGTATPWSETLGARIDDRFGSDVAPTVRSLFRSSPSDDSELCARLGATLPPGDWSDVLDAFTTDVGGFHFGRLDINTAPVEALAALPGIDPDQAARMVRARAALGPSERGDVLWPVFTDIVEPEAYAAIGGHLTTRCFTWRIRLAAGEVGADGSDETPLDNPVIYDAVIDLAGPRPRVAYLRDVSMLEVAALLAAETAVSLPDEGPVDDDEAAGTGDGLEGADPTTRPDDRDPEESEAIDGESDGSGFDGAPESVGDDETDSATPPAGEPAAANTGRGRLGRWTGGR